MAKYYVEVDEYGTFWYKDPEMKFLHREHDPAIEWANGDKSWLIDGSLHREGGPAMEKLDGYKVWYNKGLLHREDGPAMEDADGGKYWYLNGKLHRVGGPAVIMANGQVEYWLDNEMLTKDQWEARTQRVEELTIAQIEQLLGKRVKIIK